MAYPIKKVHIGFPKQRWDAKEIVQDRINKLLYEAKKDDGVTLNKPKLLTIIIKKNKENHFHFLRDETEFGVQGIWKSTKHHPTKTYKENNVEIQIQYLDNNDGSVAKKLDNLFKQYNKNWVNEEVLYVTSTPIDKTSLNLQEGRDGI